MRNHIQRITHFWHIRRIGSDTMSKLQQFLYDKLTDCEALFEQANANSDIIYMKGMLEIGGMQTQLIANIGKRQAYQEVLEFIRKEQME